MNRLRIMDELSGDNSTLSNVCSCIGWRVGLPWFFWVLWMVFS